MEDASLWALFISAFVSSTLLPGGSEALLLYLSQEASAQPYTLLWVATLGNTLGGLTSWGIGWRFPARKLVRVEHQQAVARVQRWGSPLLLLSWMPLIGDPLCVAAGWLRIPFSLALLFIGVGKAVRYAVLLWVF